MKKTTVLEILGSLEEEFETEKLIERLLLVEKIEKEIQESDVSKVLDYEEVKRKFSDKWER